MIFRPKYKKFVYLSAAVLWGGLIFYLSSVPNLASGLPSWPDLILRKSAHVIEYGILTYFLLKASPSRWAVLVVLPLVIAYAFTDEWHQSFVGGRLGSARDLFFDYLGVLSATVYFYQKNSPFLQRRVK